MVSLCQAYSFLHDDAKMRSFTRKTKEVVKKIIHLNISKLKLSFPFQSIFEKSHSSTLRPFRIPSTHRVYSEHIILKYIKMVCWWKQNLTYLDNRYTYNITILFYNIMLLLAHISSQITPSSIVLQIRSTFRHCQR